MKKQIVFAAAASLMLAGSAWAQTPKTDDEKALYALGYSIGQDFALSKAEVEIVKKGMADGSTEAKPLADPQTFGPRIRQVAQARASKAADKRKAQEKGFLEKAAKEKGAQKHPAGFVYVPLKEGKGNPPKATDTVKVHYKGTLTDGTEFDSSYSRNQPAEFPLNGVIKCWTEGVQKIKPGGKAKLVCPSDVAYGDQGRPPKIPGGATLVFEIELLEVKAAQAAPGGK